MALVDPALGDPNPGDPDHVTDHEAIHPFLTAVAAQAIVADGSRAMAGTLDMNGNPIARRTVATNNQTGTSYSLVAADASKVVELNNAATVTVTVPPNSSVAFPIGTEITLWRQGAGSVTVAPGGGVTILAAGGILSLASQYERGVLRKRATDEWEFYAAGSGGSSSGGDDATVLMLAGM